MLYTINALEIDRWEGGKGGTPEKQRIKQEHIAKCVEGCLPYIHIHSYLHFPGSTYPWPWEIFSSLKCFLVAEPV